MGIYRPGVALLHAVKRRPEYYGYYIIVFGGFLGAAVYMVVEMVPDTALLSHTFHRFGRRSRIRQMERVVEDNPSAGNYEELAGLLLDQKQYAQARDGYDRAIAARADSLDAFYRRGICSLELGDIPRALQDFERVCQADPRYDHDRAAASLARVYALAGRPESAGAWFSRATQFSNWPETHYHYACFLKQQGRGAEARAVAEGILKRKRGMPVYLRRIERPWFRKARALLKTVPAKPEEKVGI